MPESPFLVVEEIAALLRVPVSWIYEQTRRVGSDPIPAYRGGKRLLFDRDEVLAWFKRVQAVARPTPARARHLPAIRRRDRVHTDQGGMIA